MRLSVWSTDMCITGCSLFLMQGQSSPLTLPFQLLPIATMPGQTTVRAWESLLVLREKKGKEGKKPSNLPVKRIKWSGRKNKRLCVLLHFDWLGLVM